MATSADNSDHRPIPPGAAIIKQEEALDIITYNSSPPPPPDLMKSISTLRNLSTALSTFHRRYDELQQHLDFIQNTINSLLSDKSSIPIPSFPNSQPKTTARLSPDTRKPNLVDSEQNSGNVVSDEPSTSTVLEKSESKALSEPKSDTKLPDSDETNETTDVNKICSTLTGRHLRRYLMANISDLNKLRDEVPKALKLAPNPAKMVLECFGRFYLQGIKAYNKNSPMIAGRQASIFALECFLRMGIVGVVIENEVKKEAETAAKAWRTRLKVEGGLTKACETDAWGLLLLISCFGIPSVFRNEDIKYLVGSSNAKEISGVLRSSGILMARIPAIIEEMLKNRREIEAVDLLYTFEVQDKFPPRPILTSFLSKSTDIWKRNSEAGALVNEANKKHLADLKSIIKCLEDHKIDYSKSFPELEIDEKISILEKEIADHDKKLGEKVMTKRKAAGEAESSKRLKTQEVKRTRFAGRVPQHHQRVAASHADGKRLSYEGFTASSSEVHGSGAGLLHEYGMARGSGGGAGLLHEYSAATRAGSGVSLIAAGAGGFLPKDPYAAAQRRMLVDTDPYKSQLYGWRGDAAAATEIGHSPFAGQPSLSVGGGYNGLYRQSQSIEGFAGLPDGPSAAVSSRRSASADLYQFADSVLESESSRPGGSTLHPNVPSHRNSSYLH